MESIMDHSVVQKKYKEVRRVIANIGIKKTMPTKYFRRGNPSQNDAAVASPWLGFEDDIQSRSDLTEWLVSRR